MASARVFTMAIDVGFQRWEHLLFVHWEVGPESLQARLPDPLTVDAFDSRAYVSILPFVIPESRPLLFPPALAPFLPASSFVELNFRTYVLGPDGEPGVWFFSLDASSAVAVAGARLVYRLPYFRATMSHSVRQEAIQFSSTRKGGKQARCTAAYRSCGTASPATPGTLDRFLVERYVLFAGSSRRLLRARVHHAPYAVQEVDVIDFTENLLELEGLETATRLPVNHYAAGLDVKISRPERVRHAAPIDTVRSLH